MVSDWRYRGGEMTSRERLDALLARASMAIVLTGIAVSYAQTGLKLQSRRKKLVLTTKPTLVIRMSIVCASGRFNMLGCN